MVIPVQLVTAERREIKAPEGRRVKEDTKATRVTKVKGEEMELMGARVNPGTLDFRAVKVLLDLMVCKESRDQKETQALMGRKENQENLVVVANQAGLATMDHWDLRGTVALVEQMGTKESAAMMEQLDQMETAAIEDKWERRENKGPVETEVQEVTRVSQDPEESRGGRAQLAPTETLASLADPVLLATEEMKAHLDQRELKDREESKELQETEARWGRGEKMVSKEMVLLAAQVSRVILGLVETLVSRVARELLAPKEMMETLEMPALITSNQEVQVLKGPKVTEALTATRDLLGLLDHQEPMNVKSWISS